MLKHPLLPLKDISNLYNFKYQSAIFIINYYDHFTHNTINIKIEHSQTTII